jgi:rod shape-determining protein MreD
VILVFLQVLILNNVQLTEYGITPFFYIIFILLLPFETPGWSLLLFAFFLGFFIDMFCDTGGVHAASSVFVAFLRPLILRILKVRDGYSPETTPVIYYYGFPWFFKYAALIVLLHHFSYIILIEFSFDNFFVSLLKITATTLLSLSLVLISQFLIFKR